MYKNENSYIFKKNVTIIKECNAPEIIKDYTYEPQDGDELIFCDTLKEAFEKFATENQENVTAIYGGKFPKELVPEPKPEYEYFVVGLVRDGHRKFYVYPDKTLTNDYL